MKKNASKREKDMIFYLKIYKEVFFDTRVITLKKSFVLSNHPLCTIEFKNTTFIYFYLH